MLQGEHSAILSTFIKLPFVVKIFVLSFFEWSLKTGLTVLTMWHMGMIHGSHIGQVGKMSVCIDL